MQFLKAPQLKMNSLLGLTLVCKGLFTLKQFLSFQFQKSEWSKQKH